MFVKASTLSAGAETNCLSCFVKKLRNPVCYLIASLTRRSQGFLLSFPLSRPPRILSGIKKKKKKKSRRCTYGGRPRDRSYPATDYPRQVRGGGWSRPPPPSSFILIPFLPMPHHLVYSM